MNDNNENIFHRIKCEATEETHNSGYQLMKVFAWRFETPENKTYLGLHDVVNIKYKGTVIHSIDTDNPRSTFEIGFHGNNFNVDWNVERESIRFEIDKNNPILQLRLLKQKADRAFEERSEQFKKINDKIGEHRDKVGYKGYCEDLRKQREHLQGELSAFGDVLCWIEGVIEHV